MDLASVVSREGTKLLIGMTVIVVFLAFMFFYAIASGARDQKSFMSECTQYEPAYKCLALWRSLDKGCPPELRHWEK